MRRLGAMGGLIRGQWVNNGLEMIWDLIGNVWVEYRVMTWFMALWLVGEGVTMIWMIFPVLVLVSLRVPQTWSVIVLIFLGALLHPQGMRGVELRWLCRVDCTQATLAAGKKRISIFGVTVF